MTLDKFMTLLLDSYIPGYLVLYRKGFSLRNIVTVSTSWPSFLLHCNRRQYKESTWKPRHFRITRLSLMTRLASRVCSARARVRTARGGVAGARLLVEGRCPVILAMAKVEWELGSLRRDHDCSNIL